ncbi:ABC transporter permease [Georgenia sp. Z1491]|uniref:ABC transporter permease n=1 Tax=Georgenia sp. Z1491 TaxID=3416707 RepID=UPI003CF31537
MTQSDLRQRIRDKSVIIFAIVVPLALMAVLNLVLGGAQDEELDPLTVAASVPEGDDSATTLVDTLSGIEGFDVTVEETTADDARARAEDGSAALALIVPDGFGDGLRGGDTVDVSVIEGDGAGIEGDVVLSILQGTLTRMHAAGTAAGAGTSLGLAPEDIGAVTEQVGRGESVIALAAGETADEQLDASGTLVAGQAGLFLLFTVGFGVLALVTEREQGTLARLRSMPMPTWHIVAAKALASFLLGVVATSVLLIAGSLLFDVDFGDPLPVAVLIVCVAAAGTAVMLVIARVTRTSEQAGIAQSIVALVLGMAGGAFFPMAASGLLGQVLDLNPIGAFTRGLGITSGGGGIGDIAVPAAIMLGFALVMGAVSRLVPDRGTSL